MLVLDSPVTIISSCIRMVCGQYGMCSASSLVCWLAREGNPICCISVGLVLVAELTLTAPIYCEKFSVDLMVFLLRRVSGRHQTTQAPVACSVLAVGLQELRCYNFAVLVLACAVEALLLW